MEIEDKIRAIASNYSDQLSRRIDERVNEMRVDDTAHFLIYQVLGVTDQEGHLIDLYQNKGRFLYRYAGAFLESAAKICFSERFPDSAAVRVPNTRGQRPRTFEIDYLINAEAIELKWRDATTDGDHITKEHTRILAISDAGFTPIRVMFYYPNRSQAIRIQQAVEALYKAVNGQYHYGDTAWHFISNRTGVDLKGILKKLAGENVARNES